jgi:hypothetical protein
MASASSETTTHLRRDIKRAADAGRKIREAELEYQAKRMAKQQAKLTDAVMRGLEHQPHGGTDGRVATGARRALTA